jgi:GT2 family glycosyltransferase
MMKVDVVILSWNRLPDTLEAIASAQAQVGVDVLVYVVDQGSDASTVEALRALATSGDIHLAENGENLGVGAGRNVVMRLGDSPYICAIDSDAVFADEHQLARAVAILEENPQVGVAGFNIVNYFTGEHDWVSWSYPHSQRSQADTPFLTTRFCGAGHIIRRAVYEQTRGFDDVLFFMWEELDLSYQLINLGYTIRYSPEIRVRHKLSPHMRIEWRGKRYYYFVRHRLYVDFKYNRSWGRWWRYAVGYFIKSSRHRAWLWAWGGIRDSRMLIRTMDKTITPLTPSAKAYIRRYEDEVRGNFFQRIRYEVFRRL